MFMRNAQYVMARDMFGSASQSDTMDIITVNLNPKEQGRTLIFVGMVVFTNLYMIARISAFVLDAPNALMARFEKHLQAESKNHVQIAKVV